MFVKILFQDCVVVYIVMKDTFPWRRMKFPTLSVVRLIHTHTHSYKPLKFDDIASTLHPVSWQHGRKVHTSWRQDALVGTDTLLPYLCVDKKTRMDIFTLQYRTSLMFIKTFHYFHLGSTDEPLCVNYMDRGDSLSARWPTWIVTSVLISLRNIRSKSSPSLDFCSALPCSEGSVKTHTHTHTPWDEGDVVVKLLSTVEDSMVYHHYSTSILHSGVLRWKW